MKKFKRASVLLLAMIMLAGCSAPSDNKSTAPTQTAIVEETQQLPSDTPTTSPTSSPTPSPAPTMVPTAEPDPVSRLTDTQRNSINMLNWLAYLTQDINASSNNRLFLENVYSLIVNETYPNAVDERTQDRLANIRQALLRYRMTDIKRERIEYLYEQNKAQAIKAAIPSLSALLISPQIGTSSQTGIPFKTEMLIGLVQAVVFMPINSIGSYQSAKAQAEMQYLQDGWELSDEEDETFYSIRSDAFDYMVDICREYNLPGYMSLNEKSVEEFVSWKNNSNIVRRIQFLESNRSTYKAFGSYYLVLADSYYTHGDYEKCLKAIASYEELSTQIFRRDNEYAKVLPLGIAAAESVMDESTYIDYAEKCADAILKNIGIEDWALRYFAAQTYVDLFARTQQSDYLWEAYRAITDNVNYLIDEQLKQNSEYLADVQDEKPSPTASADEKTQIDACNKLRREARKTELPPIYEPLLLNLELLSALSNQLSVGEEELQRIDSMLHENGQKLFLIDELEQKYGFMTAPTEETALAGEVEFDGRTLKVPAIAVSENADIRVAVTDAEGNETTFDDWTVSEVSRRDKADVKSFVASYTSAQASEFQYRTDMNITITVLPHTEYECEGFEAQFKTINAKPNWYDRAVFWTSDIGFERLD